MSLWQAVLLCALVLGVGAAALVMCRLDPTVRRPRASQTGRDVHCPPEVQERDPVNRLRRRGGA